MRRLRLFPFAAIAFPPILLMLLACLLMTRHAADAFGQRAVAATLASIRSEYGMHIEARLIETNLRDGRVDLYNFSINNLDKSPLMAGKRLTVLLPLPWRYRANVRAVAVRGAVWVRRDRNGRYEIERLLAKHRKPSAAAQPLEIVASDVDVHYLDQSGDLPASTEARLRHGRCQIVGEEGLVRVALATDGLGEIQVSVRWDKAGGGTRLSAGNAKASDLLPILVQRLKLGIKDVRPGDASGPVMAAARWGRETDWIAEAEIGANNAGYQRHTARSGRLRAVGAPDGWALRGGGSVAGANVSGSARIVLGKTNLVAAELSLAGKDVARTIRDAGVKTKADINGSYTAALTVRGSLDDPSLSGSFTVAGARWDRYRAANISGCFQAINGKGLQLRNLRGSTLGSDMVGAADYDPHGGAIRAGARLGSVQLAKMAEMSEQGISGVAQVVGLVGGTAEKPTVMANLITQNLHIKRPLVEDKPEWTGDLGALLARLHWSGGRLDIPLAQVDGPAGRLKAVGSYESDAGTLSGRFDLEGGRLAWLQPTLDLGGTIFADGSVSGTAEEPIVSGHAELFSPRYEDTELSLVTGEFDFRDQALTARGTRVRLGLATADVVGSVRFGEESPVANGVVARFEGLDARELVDRWKVDVAAHGRLAGTIRADGPLDDLSVSGSARAPEGYLDRWTFEDFRAALEYANQTLRLRDVAANIGSGFVTGGGARFPDGTIRLTANLVDADLSSFNDYLPSALPVDGLVSGSIQFNQRDDAREAHASFRLSSSSLAGLDTGSGEGEAHFDGASWSGRLEVSGQERAFQATLDNLDSSARTVRGSAQATLSVHDAEHVLRRTAPDANPEVVRLARRLGGAVEVSVGATGSLDSPELPFTISAKDLVLDRAPFASFQTRGTARNDLYKFEIVELIQSAGRVVGSGTFEPGGMVDGSVEVTNLDSNVISLLFPASAGLHGTIDATALIRGPSHAPDIDMTATLNEFGLNKLALDSASFGLITIRDGRIQTDGAVLQKQGYVARLSGDIPFRYKPFGIPEDQPMHGELSIPAQQLDGLGVFAADLDRDLTSGTIHGGAGPESPITIVLAGTPAAPLWKGGLALDGDSLGWKGVDERLTDFHADVNLDNDTIRLQSVRAKTASGGEMTASASSRVTELLESPLQGLIEFHALNLRQVGKTPDDRMKAAIDGTIHVAGTLIEPALSGALTMNQADIALPSGWSGAQAAPTGDFDPHFDIRVGIAPGTIIRSPRLEAKVQGGVILTRSLSSPMLSGRIDIVDGRMSLPTARLAIQPGSNINITYVAQPEQEPLADVQVDLIARTNLVTTNQFGVATTYRIDMDIRGSLLDESGLRMRATSSPPDLTEPQIFALLGHTALFQTSQGDFGAGLQNELKDIFGATVLPAIFDKVAEATGFEVLSFTLNQYEPLTLNVAKSLFDGFSLSYRRSLEGVEPRYEVKLLWQLPLRQRFFRHLNLGLSYDETREYRVRLEWSTRF